MNFSETFIRRPIATSLMMAAIALFGLVAYRSLPVSDLPNVDFPTLLVTASLPGASPDTMASAADLALAYLSQGKFDESEPLAREALDFNRKNQPDDWQRFRAESLLGASLAGQKKYAEAEPLLLSGYQGMVARKDRIDVPDWYHLDRAHEWLVQLYQAWGKPQKAAEWRKK